MIDGGPDERLLAHEPIKRDVELLAHLTRPSFAKSFQGFRV